jgi:ribosomal protein S18 acetylase RimI-like enzyme
MRLLRQALTREPAVVTLNVFEQNTRARRFYERHGFQEVRRFLNEQEQSVELVYVRGGAGEVSGRAASNAK